MLSRRVRIITACCMKRSVRTILSQCAYQLFEMRAAAAVSSKVDERLIATTVMAVDSSRRLLEQLDDPRAVGSTHEASGEDAPLHGKAG
jgi:hypothetical protein